VLDLIYFTIVYVCATKLYVYFNLFAILLMLLHV